MLNKLTKKGLMVLAAVGFASSGALVPSGTGSANAAELVNGKNGMLEVHGSTTVSRTVLIPHKEDLDKAVGRKIHVIANGSSKGIIALINGKADVAMISAPFADVRASVERKAPGTIGKIELNQHRIGSVKTRFIIHPDNPVRFVTEDQLRAILVGKIVNWNEVGGPDMRIGVFTTKPGKGLRSLVEKQFLGGTSIVASAQELAGLSQVVQVVSQAKHGIGFVNEPRLNGSVAVLPGLLVEQPLILVTKGAANADVRALIDAMAQRAPS
jgi:phosphate transport system substrate-binding protein